MPNEMILVDQIIHFHTLNQREKKPVYKFSSYSTGFGMFLQDILTPNCAIS